MIIGLNQDNQMVNINNQLPASISYINKLDVF